MYAITVEKKALRAISLFTSVKDIRYYLNGVLVELSPDGARLVATNGHMLAVIRCRGQNGGDIAPNEKREYIIPRDAFKSIKKAGRRDAPAVFLQFEGDTFTIIDGETKTTGKVIDGKYPDYRRIFSGPINDKPAQFNAEYVWAFHEAAREYGQHIPQVSIGHNGDMSATVNIGEPDFFGVLMPMRSHDVQKTPPAWVMA